MGISPPKNRAAETGQNASANRTPRGNEPKVPFSASFFATFSDTDGIDKGYPQQVKQYHPDENQHDAQDFVDISLEEIRQDRDIYQCFYDKDTEDNIRETPSKGVEDAG